MMKKLSVLVMSLVVLGFSACSSDDDNSSVEPDDSGIVGDWQMTDVNFDGNTIQDGMVVGFSGQTIDLGDDDLLKIKDDNTYEATTTTLKVKVSVSINGNENDPSTMEISSFFHQ